MVSVFEDNVRIYLLLEKADVLFGDFSIDHIVSFDHDDDFYVVVYFASDKNFICFEGTGYQQNTNVLPELIQLVQDNNDVIVLPRKDEVVKLIEHKMHSKNNSRFFFDAH